YARTALPCFDEPDFKAVFNVSVVHSNHLKALSNAEAKHTHDLGIWTQPNAYPATEVAAQVGPRLMRHFAERFQQPYPLPKQDMMAVSQMLSGAMENWGLIIYSVESLLYRNETCWLKEYDGLLNVVAHELSHQWFGNLVTMRWWNDLWMNEGFATLYEYLAPVQLENNKNKWVSTSRRLIDQGGSVLRMLRYKLGAKIFDKCVQHYLKKYAYRNTDHDQLWEAMNEVISKNPGRDPNFHITEDMDSWFTEAGYPLLTVERNYNSGSVIISQRRFLLNSTEENEMPFSSSWYIPVWYRQEGAGSETLTSIKEGQKSIEIQGLGDGWLLVNFEARSLCRVNYDERNWKLLYEQLMMDHTVRRTNWYLSDRKIIGYFDLTRSNLIILISSIYSIHSVQQGAETHS
ncbi:unnamed protein product, partial [Soboliphyme baturini]|uniref:Peptidase_M1 domain-containing protein n=1 Tax=Soboliphyme baturini TaxID=241478 RepID=A0A183J7N5_9BILA